MPSFGASDSSVTGVYVAPQDMQKHERLKNPTYALSVPRESPYMREVNKKNASYIYNVSPYSHQQPSGSVGTFYVPGLAKDKVLKDDLLVAGPLVIPAHPSETIPRGDNRASREYYEPKEGMPNWEKPGFRFAMEIVGAGGLGAQVESNLTLQGVFVTELRGYNPVPAMPADLEHGGAQETLDKFNRETVQHYGLSLPRMENIEEVAEELHSQAAKVYGKFKASPFFKEWQQLVIAAQDTFREYARRKCEFANAMYGQNLFHQVRDEKLYELARYIGKTRAECPWLANAEGATNSKECWSCGRVTRAKYKCECGALQVSQLEYDAEVKRRAAGV